MLHQDWMISSNAHYRLVAFSVFVHRVLIRGTMPSVATANRLRIFEEGNGSAIFTPLGLVVSGNSGADGCLARYEETWAAKHFWEPDEARFVKLVQRLPTQKLLAAAVAESQDALKWDIKTFNEEDLSLHGMLFRSSVPVKSLAANGDGSIVYVQHPLKFECFGQYLELLQGYRCFQWYNYHHQI